MRASGSRPSRFRYARLWPAAILAAAFVAAHAPFLPPSLEDIDSINFALGLRHFDPALHQPHPPGYPLFIALGHVSLSLFARLGILLSDMQREAVALAVWSLLGGALAIVAAELFYRGIEQAFPDDAARLPAGRPLGATALLAVAPLFSIAGVRPLSDMAGLALALLAQAMIVRGIASPRALIAGAFVAGLCGGIRVQSALLTAPEGRSLPAVLAPELRLALLRLSRSERARALGQRALRAPRLFDALGERLAVDVFHDQRARSGVVFDAIDGRDVRMIERAQRPRFALDAREARRIVGEFPRQHLQRHVAAEPLVPCAIDLAHAAEADQGGDRIATDARADVERRARGVHQRRFPEGAGIVVREQQSLRLRAQIGVARALGLEVDLFNKIQIAGDLRYHRGFGRMNALEQRFYNQSWSVMFFLSPIGSWGANGSQGAFIDAPMNPMREGAPKQKGSMGSKPVRDVRM